MSSVRKEPRSRTRSRADGTPVAVGAAEDAEVVQPGAAGVGDGVDLLELDRDQPGQPGVRRRCGSRSGPGRRRRPSASQRQARSKAPSIGWWSASKMPTNSPSATRSAALTFCAFEVLSCDRTRRGPGGSAPSAAGAARPPSGRGCCRPARPGARRSTPGAGTTSRVSTMVSASLGRYAAMTAVARGAGSAGLAGRTGGSSARKHSLQISTAVIAEGADQPPVERRGEVDAEQVGAHQRQERQQDAADRGEQHLVAEGPQADRAASASSARRPGPAAGGRAGGPTRGRPRRRTPGRSRGRACG